MINIVDLIDLYKQGRDYSPQSLFDSKYSWMDISYYKSYHNDRKA